MKTKLLLLALLFISTSAIADEMGDTIVLKSGKSVIINEDGNDIDVSVVDASGDKIKQVYEKKVSNEKEVEYFISSPFFPKSTISSKRRKSFIDTMPVIFVGSSTLKDGSLGKSISNSRDSKSWEIGITLATLQVPISYYRRYGVTSGVQLINTHHHFGNNRILTSDNNGVVSLRESPDELKKSYMSYWTLHVPVMFEAQKRAAGTRMNIAFGPYIEWHFSSSSRYYVKNNKTTETHELNMNPIGIGLEARVGVSGFQIYARTSLTSLVTTHNPTWVDGFYPITIGVGF